MNKTHDTQKYHTTLAEDNAKISNSEARLRYYEITNSLSEELEKKKEIIDSTKQIQINESKSLIKENKCELETTVYDHNDVKRKVSIGGYIPIDHL